MQIMIRSSIQSSVGWYVLISKHLSVTVLNHRGAQSVLKIVPAQQSGLDPTSRNEREGLKMIRRLTGDSWGGGARRRVADGSRTRSGKAGQNDLAPARQGAGKIPQHSLAAARRQIHLLDPFSTPWERSLQNSVVHHRSNIWRSRRRSYSIVTLLKHVTTQMN